jgi:hypothetical protein
MNEIDSNRPFLESILTIGGYCEPDAHGRCITCGDEALPATVLQIDELLGTAVVAVENETTEIDISLVDDVAVGQVLLVHGGVALGRTV